MYGDNVKKPATIPYGFIGPWMPPTEYGNLISPPINVTSQNWAPGVPQADAVPQFATDQGQQIGSIFFPYGSLGTNPGGAPCALGNNWNEGVRYGAPSGYDMIYFAQVEAADNWQGILGQPFAPFPIVAQQRATLQSRIIAEQTTLAALEQALANLP